MILHRKTFPCSRRTLCLSPSSEHAFTSFNLWGNGKEIYHTSAAINDKLPSEMLLVVTRPKHEIVKKVK